MARGRKAINPETKAQPICVKLDPRIRTRMQIICFRRSIHRMKKFSESQLISGHIVSTKLPAVPTKEQIHAYVDMYPQHRELVAEMSKLAPPGRT